MPSLDSHHAVLLVLIGVSVALIGLVFLLVNAFVAGGLLLALGSALGGVGYVSAGGASGQQ